MTDSDQEFYELAMGPPLGNGKAVAWHRIPGLRDGDQSEALDAIAEKHPEFAKLWRGASKEARRIVSDPSSVPIYDALDYLRRGGVLQPGLAPPMPSPRDDWPETDATRATTQRIMDLLDSDRSGRLANDNELQPLLADRGLAFAKAWIAAPWWARWKLYTLPAPEWLTALEAGVANPDHDPAHIQARLFAEHYGYAAGPWNTPEAFDRFLADRAGEHHAFDRLLPEPWARRRWQTIRCGEHGDIVAVTYNMPKCRHSRYESHTRECPRASVAAVGRFHLAADLYVLLSPSTWLKHGPLWQYPGRFARASPLLLLRCPAGTGHHLTYDARYLLHLAHDWKWDARQVVDLRIATT